MNARERLLGLLGKYHGDKFLKLCQRAFEYRDGINSESGNLNKNEVEEKTNKWFYEEIFEPEMNKTLQNEIKENFPKYGELKTELLTSLNTDAVFALDELEEINTFFANTIIYLNFLYDKTTFWNQFENTETLDFSGVVLECVENAKKGAEEIEKNPGSFPSFLRYLNDPFEFVNTQFESYFDKVMKQEKRWQQYNKQSAS